MAAPSAHRACHRRGHGHGSRRLRDPAGGRRPMTERWLLVHPPLLGPAVLRPLADALRARGHVVELPDLRWTVAEAQGWPQRWTAAAAAAGPVDVVLGFSGAGVILPSVA